MEEVKKINRIEALGLVKKKIKNKNLINHCLAVEAIMEALARELNKKAGGDIYEEEKWG